MLTLAKFVFGCFIVGSLALVGSSFLPASARTALGLQAASAQADFMLHRVIAQSPSSLNSLSASTSAFVRSNATSARLQAESMKNSLPSSVALSNFIPSSSSTWIQSGVQSASRVAGNKPGNLAKKIPVVNGALNSAGEHIATLRQSLSNAGASF